MRRLRIRLGAIALVAFALSAGTAGATSPNAVTPSFNATAVATCDGVTDVTVTVNATDPPAVTLPLDVMFVLDESGSIVAPDFQREKNFVQSFISASTFGPTAVKAGIVQFSSNARLSLALTASQAFAANTVSTLFQRGGSTAIGDGLQLAHTEFGAHGRVDTKRVYILLTDGFNNVNVAAFPSVLASIHADPLAVVYAIGVGPSLGAGELNTIAGPTGRVFTTPDWTQVSGLLAQLEQQLNPAGSDLSYSLAAVPGWKYVPGSATATSGSVAPAADGFNWSLAAAHTGTVTIHYRLQHTGVTGGTLAPQSTAELAWTDGLNGAQTQSFAGETVTVDGCNQAPTAHASAPSTVALSGSHTASVALDGSASTDDGQLQPLSYSWSEGGSPIATGATPSVDLGLGPPRNHPDGRRRAIHVVG